MGTTQAECQGVIFWHWIASHGSTDGNHLVTEIQYSYLATSKAHVKHQTA